MKKLILLIIIFLFSLNNSCKKEETYFMIRYYSPNLQLVDYKQESRYGFISDFPYNFQWQINIPANSLLEFSLAIERHKLINFPNKVIIQINEEKTNQLILNKEIKSLYLSRNFQKFQIRLDKYRNKNINLKFSLINKEDNLQIKEAVYWEQPKIFSEEEYKGKNIIIISIDTLRADHLGFNGYYRKISPNLDKFSKESINFKNFFSVSSSTWPSLASLMTSLYPSQHGVIYNGYKLTKNIISLPEILHQNNFLTAAILGNMKKFNHKGYDFIYRGYNDELVLNKTLRLMENYKNKKFFLWIHFLGPHASYSAPEQFYQKHKIKPEEAKLGLMKTHYSLFKNSKKIPKEILEKIILLYDINIEYTDSLVGKIIKKIEELDLKRKTTIIITADHGEELCQHHNFLYHAGSLYDSVLHIPLLWHSPDINSSKKEITQIASIIDIAPTILDIFNIKPPSSFQGESLLKTFSGKALKRDWVFSETHGKYFTLRNKKYRYITNPTKTAINVIGLFTLNYKEEFYNHTSDDLELNNVINAESENYNYYKIFLRKWIDNNLPKDIPSQILDPNTIEQLKSLGYIR